jgi:hypothetical protein
MCIEAMKWLLAEQGVASPFGVDGAFVLSSEPLPSVSPPTDDDFARLLDQSRPPGNPA